MSIERFYEGAVASQLRALTPPPPVKAVSEILAAVSERGDAALIEFEEQFGASPGAGVSPVDPATLAAAAEGLERPLLDAIELAIANVTALAKQRLTDEASIGLPQGHTVRTMSLPVKRAAAYVPGGRGSYPSTAIMCLATAKAAGVDEVFVISPARPNGQVDRTVLAVCSILGINEVYPIGGAQAIAAAAWGTETIAAADVIVGPGNAYVQEAKRQLVGVVGIDSVAGPSELVIVADASADPHLATLDLLAQAEHGPDSLVVLIATDENLLEDVARECAQIDAALALVRCDDLDRAVQLADEIAPEHMQLMVEAPQLDRLAAEVRRAGALFVGHNAATAFGDYVIGSNHVLPTGGAARYASALSVDTFRRRMAQISVPDEAVDRLADAGSAIARAEGFTRHAESMEARRSD